VLEWVRKLGLEVKCLNTATNTLNRNLFIRTTRLWPMFRAILGVHDCLRNNPGAVVYCSVSGGYAILGEMLVVWMARKHHAQVVLHHHSFRYLDQPFASMRWLARIAGPTAVHVVLGKNMEQALRNRYPQVQQTLVLSSAAFVDDLLSATDKSDSNCRVIGHLSNLNPDKGVFEVVELARWAEREKLNFEFRVAGQFEDEQVKREFEARTRQLTNLHYLGPLNAEEKKKFFEDLDVFVFPTRYRNEAGPKVLIEALSQGCPVISYDRGCIASMIDSTCGVLLPRQEAFLPVASATLLQWQTNPSEFANRRHAAREKFEKLLNETLSAKQKLLNILSGK
jgi:glycosyltransferase involved in cell wall biosynthesis